jgi:hypothetical protein
LNTDVSYAELKGMTVNSLRTAFIDPASKAELLRELQTQLSAFEAAHGTSSN